MLHYLLLLLPKLLPRYFQFKFQMFRYFFNSLKIHTVARSIVQNYPS
jgi:hypothetical protein